MLLACLMASGCGAATDPINVTTAKVKAESALSETTYNGIIKAVNMEDVTADVNGKVTEMNVREGQSVRAGDVLFRLDSTEYHLQAKQAEASLNAAKTALSGAKASQTSNASVIPAQTTSADAHVSYERMKQLHDAGGISDAEFEAARSKMETADAQLSAAKIAQRSASDSAAAQVESAGAAYELAVQRLSDCTVTAPISGQVSQISIGNGSIVSTQSPAMAVVDNSMMKVSVDILERDVEKVSSGMAAEATVQSIRKTCKGSVYEVAPSADAKTGMFRVSVTFDPGDSGILAGMWADVRILTAGGQSGGASEGTAADERSGVLYVPKKSIVTEDNASYVYVMDGNHVRKQKVETGGKKNQYIQIVNGLKPDDEVVVQSGGQLADGAAVQVMKN